MKRPAEGRALFYHRDSGGKHETTPGEYVAWAVKTAAELRLGFDGAPDRMMTMIREGRSNHGDLFLDYDVKGNVLSREGLDAMFEEALRDPRVSHVLIPRRDRLARPDAPIEAVQLENKLRSDGLTLVFMDKTCPPLPKKKRGDIGDQIAAMIDYDRAGGERRTLAQKILYAQIHLAKAGFSTGGRAPFGFRRWLVREDGAPVRELPDRECVRMPGHHVVWLPGPEEELRLIRRILEMLETLPAARVAAQLTAEGIPSPNAGRRRTDGGVAHPVSGVWHQTTITNIARNPLLVGIRSYGLRSMGDELRMGPDGPRELTDDDYRLDRRTQEFKPKVIRNAQADRITASARFDPLVETGRHERLLAALDQRAGTQRGKPRSRDPKQNPLGTRIFDMACGWPLYRQPYSGSFRYVCGLYQQSHGASCNHNAVDGPTATRFLLSCHRQRLLSPTVRPKIEMRLKALAARAENNRREDRALAAQRTELAEVQLQLKTVTDNMALAQTSEQFEAVSTVFNRLKARESALQTQIAEGEREAKPLVDADAQVALAMTAIDRLTDLAADPAHLERAAEIFRLTNARLFLRFDAVPVKKRVLNKVAGGIVTFGDALAPIELYNGPTGREKLKAQGTEAALTEETDRLCLTAPPENSNCSGLEDNSLGNVSRGDRIRTCDLLVPNQTR